MRIRRKTNQCQNCGYTLGEVYNYCPNCGQENNNNDISFGKLLKEFVHNYFSLDSKFRNSLVPFLWRPGYITKEFNSGKRVSYANPIRLYLVMSLLYFFTLTLSNNYTAADDEFNKSALSRSSQDTLATTQQGIILDDDQTVPGDTSWWKKLDWRLIDDLQWNKEYSNLELLDSMDIELSFVERRLAIQTIKLYRTDIITFKNHLVGNSPIMMVFMVPIFAVFLKLFFRKKGRLYIKHLMHSIHLHSFAYLIYSIGLVFLLFSQDPNYITIVIFIPILVVSIYFIKSMKLVYGRRLLGTVFRFFMTGAFYMIALAISVILLLGVTLVIF